MEPTNQQKHDAGRHFAVGEALLHGYKADVVGPHSYIEVNGHRAKVQAVTKGDWQMDVDEYTAETIEHIVLVNLTGGLRDFYICPGDALRSDVRQRYEEFLSRNSGTRPRNPDSKHAFIHPTHVRQWQNNWSRFDAR